MNKRFENKSIIVTGAGSGIGEDAAKRFNEEGGLVTLVGRDKQKLERVQAACPHPEKIFVAAVDLSNLENIPPLIEQVKERFGALDILVNNHGIAKAQTYDQVRPEDWNNVMNTNLTTFFFLIQAFTDSLKKDGKNGVVVNVSSVAGRLRSMSLGAHYSTSKAAIIGLTRHLAGELGPLGIRVNCTCPSQTYTPMLEDAINDEQEKILIQRNPLGRIAQVGEQAAVILFLASEESSYMNGSIVDVNGGVL